MRRIEDFKYYLYPNPFLRRNNYLYLNGKWKFDFVSSFTFSSLTKEIYVPFVYECKNSGINDTKEHNYLHYQREFEITDLNSEYLLHFEGADYECVIYINNIKAFTHKGCYSSFYFPIRKYLNLGINKIDVLVRDSFSKYQLRGKQRTREENYECWYTQYSGIYKDVYLEKCGNCFIRDLKVRGNKRGEISYSFLLNQESEANIKIYFKNVLIKEINLESNSKFSGLIKLDDYYLYDESNINLYDFVVTSIDDTLATTFGFISIETSNSKIYINDKETYLKMILEQGYFKDKLVSGTKEDIFLDLVTIKEIGFNGIRVHQLIESNIFYYLATCLGIYLWSEVPSSYEYSIKSKEEYSSQLPLIINQNYNCPSIICYVLFNESWGIPEINQNFEVQNFVREMKELAKQSDNTRLIVLNDGWFNLTNSDLCCLHEYEQDANKFLSMYKDKNYVLNELIVNKFGKAFALNNKYNNQPIIISEFGGASLASSTGWGYGTKISDLNKYIEQLKNIFNAIYSLDYISGYCYTQVSDVEQETNGLFYEDRTLKVDINILKEIIGGNKK